MSWKTFQEDCPGCRPALIDMETGEQLADDSDIMRRVNAVWELTTLEERQAFHDVCCNNSRKYDDLRHFKHFQKMLQAAVAEAIVEKDN